MVEREFLFVELRIGQVIPVVILKGDETDIHAVPPGPARIEALSQQGVKMPLYCEIYYSASTTNACPRRSTGNSSRHAVD